MTATLLRLTSITKIFPGVRALDGVDFTLDAGEIHCLVGENGSGKSTLIKIIAGVEQHDPGGRIEIDGERVEHWRSSAAVHRGIEVIYQDLSLFPNLTVAENIAFSQLTEEGVRLMNWRRARQIAEQALGRIGADIDADAIAGQLPLASQQLVAISRALTSNVRLLIMDEPTTSLTRREIDALFDVVKDLQAKGIATLFVSHKLDEVFEIAERITVLRDGRKVGTSARDELTAGRLAFLMSGHEPDESRYAFEPASEQPSLECSGLTKAGQFHDVSFRVLPGEIVGLAGLLGSGRSQLARSLFGMNPPDTGEIRVDGRAQRLSTVQDAVRLGIGLVPENRAVEGLVMPHSVGRNAILTTIDRLRASFGLLDPRRERDAMAKATERLSIRVPSLDAAAQTLSGGNQQRLVLAKWLATEPRVLILLGPTVGIDIAAKSAIHHIIRDLAERGMGILMVSDEVGELVANCSRVLLMAKGRITAEWPTGDVTESEVSGRLLAG